MLIDLMIKKLARDGIFAIRPTHIDGCTLSDEIIESPFTEMTLRQEIKNSANDNIITLMNQLDAWSD